MNSSAVFEIPQRLTHVEAMQVLSALNAAVSAGARSIDLAGLAEFDSSALSVLLAARRARSGEVALRFVNVPDKLRRLASLYGVDALVFDAA